MASVKVNNYLKKEFICLLILLVMKRGQWEFSEKKILKICRILNKKYKITNSNLFTICVENSRPYVDFFSKKVGKSNHKIPVSLKAHKEISLALQWLSVYLCGRKVGSFESVILKELQLALKGKGSAIQRRKNQHIFAEKSRIYLKYV